MLLDCILGVVTQSNVHVHILIGILCQNSCTSSGMNQQDFRIENGGACNTLPQKEGFLKDHLTADAEESLSVLNPYSQ